jgi:hypothetical protein
MSFCLQLGKKRENAVLVDKRLLMCVIGVEDHGFFTRHLVVGGKLRRGRAGRVHQAGCHHDLGADAGREELNINVTELFEDLVLALVRGIEPTA